MNKMKHKLTIVVLYMIISSCNNTDSNEFAFSNYSWECPKEGGKEIFTSNKEEWEIDQLILDGIIIKEYSPEYIDKIRVFHLTNLNLIFSLLKSKERKLLFVY